MRVYTVFERNPLLFEHPHHLIRVDHPSGLLEGFEAMERAVHDGFWLAGYLSYEAGYALEPRLYEDKDYGFPLLLMGAFRTPRPRVLKASSGVRARAGGFRYNISREDYGRDIDTIRDHIARGEVYQITYCIKLFFDLFGDPLAFFDEMLDRQPVPYPAFIETDDHKILSCSPERFLKKEGLQILSEPMKGTWPRGQGLWGDVRAFWEFSRDRKNRAENVMIADLLRNDLGRIAHQIRAPKLFTITPYKTLFQMTSTVTGRFGREPLIQEIFGAVFPSGSVTGAPRIRAMEVIRALEREPRNIYTGAMGFISPDRGLYFNIPIRTILVRGRRAEMGIGGGIVWDSTAEGEWLEGMLKSSFVTSYR